MDNEIKNLFDAPKRNLHLTRAERLAMRAELEAFMKLYPARRSRGFQDYWRGVVSAVSPIVRISRSPRLAGAIVVAIFMVAAGGASYAAEGALPGDLLYPVKVHINEEIRAAAVFNSERRAEWEAERLARRLQEAEELAAAGNLGDQARLEIEERLQAHAERIRAHVAKLEASGKFDVAANVSTGVETSLGIHERILATVVASSTMTGGTEPLVTSLRARYQAAATAREEVERRISANTALGTAAQGRIGAADEKIRETRARLEDKRSKFSDAVAARAVARLDLAGRTLADARTKFAADDFSSAFRLAQQAYRIAQEAEILINARSSLSVRLDVDIGSVVVTDWSSGDDDDDEDGATTGSSQREELSADIIVSDGSLRIRYEDDTAVVTGTFGRANPCIDWKINVSSTKDLPPSTVQINLTEESTAEICVQVLGKPQSVRVVVPAGPDTRYIVRVGGEVAFDGKLTNKPR
ncbi:hypothetical protein C4552_01365 [Candidatus Parcubacteria bacterium]|nr:MAG: hypothetical protein C4552_01365 [Candidatus Parcubacteria bacterium]